MDNNWPCLKSAVIASYLCVIIIDLLSYFLPINGQNLVTNASYYPNYFTPSKYTFLVWILIYLLLALFTFYQYRTPHNSLISNKTLSFVRISMIAYSVVNIIWILSWLFDYFALSTMAILVAAILLSITCRNLYKADLSLMDTIFVRVPLGVLYAWICITTVINLIVLMYSIQWKIFGLSHEIWAPLIFISLAIFAISQVILNKDLAFCITFIWGYIGILVKHLTNESLDRPYPYAVAVLIACIILLIGSALYLIFVDKIVHKRWY